MNKNISDKENFVKKLKKLDEQRNKILKLINDFDYNDRLEKVRQYDGNYYQEVSNNEKYVRCLFVYNIDIVNCDTKTICISYWKDQDDYFEISFFPHFNPEKWEEDNDNWVLINKEKFDKHYFEVTNRINKSLNNKTNGGK